MVVELEVIAVEEKGKQEGEDKRQIDYNPDEQEPSSGGGSPVPVDVCTYQEPARRIQRGIRKSKLRYILNREARSGDARREHSTDIKSIRFSSPQQSHSPKSP